jgi:hypothetical protein
MEFSISNKAKKVMILTAIVGIVLAAIGMFYHAKGGHLFQRIMANLLLDGFFFFAIGLGALFFLALAYATEAGWYVYIKRVLEGMTGYIPVGGAVLLVIFLVFIFTDGAHVYLWMDPEVVKEDPIIQGKAAYLNKVFFMIRTVIYLAVFYMFYRGFRKRSLQEDIEGGTALHFKNFKKGATFLVFFAVFSSMFSWDWIMSIDVHWFSTLFGWYVFAGVWCSSMVVLMMLLLYLRGKGLMPKLNDSHIHDVGKWIFATSFLWSYLFFSQLMLYWYANIPEEVIYYFDRIQDFKLLFFGMFLINFALPMVLLMSREAKRHAGVLTFVGLIILVGHWADVFMMIAPAGIGAHASITALEIGLFLFFGSLFAFVVLTTLTKAPLVPLKHPMLDESIHHEI